MGHDQNSSKWGQMKTERKLPCVMEEGEVIFNPFLGKKKKKDLNFWCWLAGLVHSLMLL